MTWQDFEKQYLSSLRNFSLPPSVKSVNASASASAGLVAAHEQDGGVASRRRKLFSGPRLVGDASNPSYLNWADRRKYRTPVRDQGR